IVAGALGTLIGLERDLSGKDPSLRTFALICMASCLFSIISRDSVINSPAGDPSRIAAQIVTGIGFIGAGAIFKSRKRVSGLTTAALMWITAAIGMVVGFRRGDLALAATILALVFNFLLHKVHSATHRIRMARGLISESSDDED
ncbi:MAG: MgtC/SapB family protein, partial [Bdellovibrionales bacterium]|nr:MgtC/SapB family protein [Bdellovibrionales bacterium]